MSERLLVMDLVSPIDCEVDGDKVLVDLDSLIKALTDEEVSESTLNLGNRFELAKEMLLQEEDQEED